jgi:hypothetical protein
VDAGIFLRDVRDRDVAQEPTWTYSRRSRKNIAAAAPFTGKYTRFVYTFETIIVWRSPACAGMTLEMVGMTPERGMTREEQGLQLLGLQVNTYQLGESFSVEFFHDLGTMYLDGAFADTEIDRNCLVGDSLCYQLKDFMFAVSQ